MRRSLLCIFVVLCSCIFASALPALSASQYVPFGGSIRALAADGDHPNVLYAATSGGIFKSSESGGRWSPIGGALSGKTIQALFVTGGSLYAGTSGGVYRSSDNGANWQALNSGFECHDVLCIARIGGGLFAGTSKGLYQSADDGLSWVPVDGMQGFAVLAVVADPRDSSNVLAGTGNGLFKSQDAGVTWAEANGGIDASDRYIQSIEFDPEQGNIFLGTFGGGGILKSADGGNSWIPIATALSENIVWDVLFTARTLFIATYGGVYRSYDQGETWSALDAGTASSPVKALIAYGSNGIYAGGMRFGVFRSTDLGDTWLDANAGLTGAKVNSAVSGSADEVQVAANEGAYLTVDAGATWQWTAVDDAQAVVHSKTSSKYYLGAKGLYVSGDGRNWQPANGACFWIQALVVLEGEPDLLYAGSYNGIYSSNDEGHSWTKLSGDSLSSVLAIALVPGAPSVMFAGTMDGIYRSDDGGTNWSRLALDADLAVYAVTVDDENISVVYASTAAGLYQSSDDGATWALTDPAAEIFGAQTGLTNKMPLELSIAGKDIVSYRYAVNDAPYSSETAVGTSIDFSGKVLIQGEPYVVGSDALQAKLDERASFFYPYLQFDSPPNSVEIYYSLNAKGARLLDDNFLALSGTGVSSLFATLQNRSPVVLPAGRLISLKVAGGILRRGASGAATDFVLDVPPATAQVVLTAAASSELDAVTVAGVTVSPRDATVVAVEEGALVEIVVASAGGAALTYKVAVAVDDTLSANTDQASYYLRSENPQSDWLQIDNGGTGDAKVVLKLNGRPYTYFGEIAAAVRAMPDEFRGEPLQRKIWRFIRENSYHFDPFTAEPWGHSPTFYFSSVGYGYCDDVAALYYQIATGLGLESRVWALGGHIVPEVKVAGRWELYDPDMEVYYYNRQGQVAGVEELTADSTLITNPTQPFWMGWDHVYTQTIADLYAPPGNSISDYYKMDNIKGVSIHFTVPTGGRLDLPSRFLPPPASIYDTVLPEYAQARLTIPRGWTGNMDVALAVQSIRNVFPEGAYKVSVIGKDSVGRWQSVPTVSEWVLDTAPPTTVAEQPRGVYDPLTPVTLRVGENDTVHYATDGTVPTLSSPTYAGPIDVYAGLPVRFFAVDAAGNQEVPQVYPEQLTSVILSGNVDPADPSGGTVLFKAAASGGTGSYEYWFFLFNSTTGTLDQIQGYGDNPVLTWHKGAAAPGVYTIEVFARNRGSSAFYEKKQRIIYVNQPVGGVTLTASMASAIPGSKVTFTAQASGGSGSYEYDFALYDARSGSSTTVQPYGTARSWSWDTTSLTAGSFTLKVRSRNTGSSAEYEAQASIDFTLVPPPVSSVVVASDLTSPQLVGSKVVFTAQASRGTGIYEYEFLLYDVQAGSSKPMQPYGVAGSWTWDTTFYPPGSFTLQVLARNAGSAAPYEAQATADFTLVPPPVSSVALSSSLASPQQPGAKVTFTAQAAGGSGRYEYGFALCSKKTGTSTPVQGHGTKESWTWDTALYPLGEYTLRVSARNEGSASPYETERELDFALAPPVSSVAVITDRVSPQQAGAQVIFAVQASGGSGSYEYYLTWYNPNTGRWSVGRSYSRADSWAWDTAGLQPGIYVVEVWARNVGSTAPLESYKRKAYAIVAPLPATSVAVTADRVSPQQAGPEVTFSAQASGGSGSYEYYFTWYNPNTGRWRVGRSYSRADSWAWDTAGLQPGIYVVEVWARNVGSTAPLESYKRKAYTIVAPLPATSVAVTADRVSPQQAGTKVTFSAQASGGSGSYEYYFTWYNPDTGRWSVGRSYGSVASWTWDTSALTAGNYTIEVWARNSGSSLGYECYQRAVFSLAPRPAPDVSVTADLASPQLPGPKVRFTAQAQGDGGSYEYYFTWVSISTGQWKVGRAYSSTNSWDWDTSVLPPGGYIIEVWARPAGSKVDYESWARSSFTLATGH